MILKIQLIDDDGTIKAEASGPAHQPVQWKAPVNNPVVIKRGGNNGEYHIHVVTAQPSCTLVMGVSITPVQFPQAGQINIPGPNPISGYSERQIR